jgi:LPS-assembly protein
MQISLFVDLQRTYFGHSHRSINFIHTVHFINQLSDSMRRKPVISVSPHLSSSPSFRLSMIAQMLLPIFVSGFCAPALAQESAVQGKDVPVQNQASEKSKPVVKKTGESNTGSASSTSSAPIQVTIKPGVKQEDAPIVIQAEKISGQPERIVIAEDRVELVKGNISLTANKGTYRSLEDQVDAEGNVILRRDGDCYSGDQISLQVDNNTGYVVNPVYRLLRSNAQGKAERVEFESEDISTIIRGTYSTCEGFNPDWYLQVDTLRLDKGLDVGVANKSVLYFKGVPILSSPSFLPLSFSLSGERQSGLLPPVFGATTTGGTELTLPYYYNIAPNRDLTIYPKYIQRRGAQLGLEGRYLGETYSGETTVEGLLNDNQTGRNRYAITSVYHQKILPALDFSWNLNSASDDNYPTDFSHSIAKTSQRLLAREVGVTYGGSFWNASIRTSNYQVLQDTNSPIAKPYARLPQIQLHAEQHDIAGFDWALDSSITRFSHPTLVSGDRTVINPQVSFPIVAPGFFVIPKLSLHATDYQLTNQAPGQSTSFQRTLPTLSLDSGLIFERQTDLLGKALTQTLEPRLFYVNTPYRDQRLFPNFDSALSDFNFAQSFSENRFSGQDRISDSNQITAALTSRYIEDDGEERAKLSIGQRFYFNSQRVTLDTLNNGIGVADSHSDLLLAGSGKLSSTLSAEASLQISQSSRQAVMSNYGLSWRPAPKKVLNLEYRYQRDALEQVDFSVQWPLTDRWYAVGRSNYSLRDKKLVEGLAGFEYKDDCWALRFVAQRFATNAISNTTTFFIQLELNGLSRLGSNPLEILKKNISGYQSTN